MRNIVIDLTGLRDAVDEGIKTREGINLDDEGFRTYVGEEAYAAFIKTTMSMDMAHLMVACISALYPEKNGVITVTEKDPEYGIVENLVSDLEKYLKNASHYKDILKTRLAELRS